MLKLGKSNFLQRTLCANNNAVVFIFKQHDKPIAMCDGGQGNMFSKKNKTVELVHTSKAWVSFPDEANKHRDEFGRIEGQLICIYCDRPEIEIQSNYYVYLNYMEQDLLGGEIVAIQRNRLDAIMHFCVDTGKQVPFRPELVFNDLTWFREPNN
jgi:hypothetical protein